MGMLDGIRVLELGEMVQAAYAAKLMADLGADVVKVETPAGDRARRRGPFPGDRPDPECSGLFLYLNTNKQGVVLDPDSAADRASLQRLIDASDLLIHNLQLPAAERWGIDGRKPLLRKPSLVSCSITPFGNSGPHAHYRAEELNLTHAGGWGWLGPGALEDPALPPLKGFGHLADYQGALAGACASLSALYRARRTGSGECIDVSVQECVAAILEMAIPTYTYAELVSTRLGVRGLNPWGIFECQDGLIFLSIIEQDQWERLVDFMGNPEWALLEVFENVLARRTNVDALIPLVQEWIGGFKVEDLFHEGQRRRICFAPVLDMAGVISSEHLHARGFHAETTHPRAGRLSVPGAPYRLREGAWQLRSPAPLLAEKQASELWTQSRPAAPEIPAATGPELPLAGIRVADFSWVWAGPFAGMQLAHLGAEVIKIESGKRPDLGRRLAIFPKGMPPGINRSGYFNQWNQGKQSLQLDLGHPEAPALVKALVGECDVVLENFAKGVMERLGIGYEALRDANPRIVYASITGFGHTGPLSHYMGYGPAISPLSGLSSLTGYPGGAPRELGLSLGDPTAGITAATAIQAALLERETTGRGQHIDVSLWESTTVCAAEGWLEFAMNGREAARRGNRDTSMAPHGCFRCAGEDAWISIACASESEWKALCEIVDPALAGDPRFATERERKLNEAALEERISAWTTGQERWEATRILQQAGVPAFPSMSAKDLVEDPHLLERGFIEHYDHPEVGFRRYAGIPWRLGQRPGGVRGRAPLLGEHSDRVLREILELPEEDILRLRESGIFD